MDKAQAFLVIEWLRALGQPLSNDDLTVQSWALALDADMEFGWAKDFLVRHYRTASTDLRVADFNRGWRDESERRYWSRARRPQIAPTGRPVLSDGTPMPDYVREEWERMRRSTRVD